MHHVQPLIIIQMSHQHSERRSACKQIHASLHLHRTIYYYDDDDDAHGALTIQNARFDDQFFYAMPSPVLIFQLCLLNEYQSPLIHIIF